MYKGTNMVYVWLADDKVYDISSFKCGMPQSGHYVMSCIFEFKPDEEDVLKVFDISIMVMREYRIY